LSETADLYSLVQKARFRARTLYWCRVLIGRRLQASTLFVHKAKAHFAGDAIICMTSHCMPAFRKLA